jgi:hypothetical protein
MNRTSDSWDLVPDEARQYSGLISGGHSSLEARARFFKLIRPTGFSFVKNSYDWAFYVNKYSRFSRTQVGCLRRLRGNTTALAPFGTNASRSLFRSTMALIRAPGHWSDVRATNMQRTSTLDTNDCRSRTLPGLFDEKICLRQPCQKRSPFCITARNIAAHCHAIETHTKVPSSASHRILSRYFTGQVSR